MAGDILAPTQSASPGTPASGKSRLWSRSSDKRWYSTDDAGNDAVVSSDNLPGAVRLQTAPSAGATSLALNVPPTTLGANLGWVIVDPFTSECELRKITGLSGKTATVAALTYAHAANDPVLWSAEPMAMVELFGARGDDSTDDSVAFTRALASGVPVHAVGGVYRLKDVAPPSSAEMTFGVSTIVKGLTTGDDIFATTGSVGPLVVQGGRFQSARYVWNHSGNSALNAVVFRDMQIHDVTDGFRLSSAVGVLWKNVRCGEGGAIGNIVNGWNLLATGTGQTNANRWEHCKAFYWTGNAIRFGDTAVAKVSNHIVDFWAECHSGGTAGDAIFIGGTSQDVTIKESYFEACGGASACAVRLDATSGIIQSVVIERTRFAGGDTGMVSHLRNTGNSSLTARDNHVVLASGQVFAAVDGASQFASDLHNNYLNAVGAGPYQSRLYSQSGFQPVSWSVYVGSGFVPDADYPRTSFAGRVMQSAGKFATAGDAQTSTIVMRLQTTSATPGEMFLNGTTARLVIPDDTAWLFTASIVARRTTVDNESAAYKIEGCIDSNTGTVALVGTPVVTTLAEDTAGWDVAVTADDTNKSIKFSVTGATGATINWVARITLVEVTG